MRKFGNRDFRRDDSRKFKAVCSDCKQECEVPFRPTEGRPVYCNDCFKNHRRM